MNTLSYRTVSVNKENANKQWLVIDAEGKTLGRLTSVIASILRGKRKPSFTPHSDCGDNVIVINAEKIHLTGKKWTDKVYIRHTGYPGGQRQRTAEEMMARRPIRMVEVAVKGMLPKTRLGREQFRNLYVYEGAEHKHEGQKPTTLDIDTLR